MPQMAPLWWDMLYMYTLISFCLMNFIIYFSMMKMNNNKNKKFNEENNQMNWKW
uniref:ATP synthase F0 subunit 8 n=1 Tax=Dalpada cinctipes TaxID=1310295 RepID=UPI001D0F7462|nr:ATP synthase F0 subunit 8 [Dalpada cinctipes]UCC45964.1 ATP synthase F0 subunit 8 [Dalpada cinctipes]